MSDLTTSAATAAAAAEIKSLFSVLDEGCLVPFLENTLNPQDNPILEMTKKTELYAAVCKLCQLIAGAGGAAHLPGMAASMTPLPVLGVPVHSKALDGIDSLLSIVQMPGGVPVGTLAIGKAGAINAGLMAAQISALNNPALAERVQAWRAQQSANVPETAVDLAGE